MGLDGFVAVLALLLALTWGEGQRESEGLAGRKGVTDSLTTMKGRPCSSFITAAAECTG